MEQVLSVLASPEILSPSHPSYTSESRIWTTHKDRHPKYVLRPQSLESLSRLLAALNDSDVPFAVRSGGCGSTSSEGVVISLVAFDQFEWDAEGECVVVGVGLRWVDVDERMERLGNGYAGRLSLWNSEPGKT